MVSENGELGQNRAQPLCLGHSDGFFCSRRHCDVSAHQVMRCSLGCTLWQAWLAQLICWTVRKITCFPCNLQENALQFPWWKLEYCLLYFVYISVRWMYSRLWSVSLWIFLDFLDFLLFDNRSNHNSYRMVKIITPVLLFLPLNGNEFRYLYELLFDWWQWKII